MIAKVDDPLVAKWELQDRLAKGLEEYRKLKEMLTTAEAAAVLGITPQSVRRQINRGRIAAEKRGRDHFISRAEVERYAASRKMGRPATAAPR
jgi:excisionase family DNA binding protein